MKAVLRSSVCVALMLPGMALAQERYEERDNAYTLQRDTMTRIDVAGQDLITLSLESVRASEERVALPVVRVTEEYGSFECTVDSVSYENSFIRENGAGFTDTFHIVVDWMPGTDSSGCVLDILDAYSGEVYQAELYMLY